MTAWHYGPTLGVDFETTDSDPTEAIPVSVALAWFDGEKLEASRYALIDPGIAIPEAAKAIHGLSDSDVGERGGPLDRSIRGVAEIVLKASSDGVPVIGFAVSYDLTVLDTCLRRLGDPGLSEQGFCGPVIDALVLDRHCDRFRKGSRKLTAVAEHYGVDLPAAHHALADAIAAVKVARAISEKYAEVGHADLDMLYQLQKGWHRSWAEEFSEYRVSKGEKPLDPSEMEWPLRGEG